MLRNLNNKEAQAIVGEYILVIFLMIATIVAMTIFFKRSVQARIHDARDYMVSEVRSRTQGSYQGNLYMAYEPYYANTAGRVDRMAADQTRLLPGASSGIFQKDYNQTTSINSQSTTAPPQFAD